jgi:signal transduction histidine kinase
MGAGAALGERGVPMGGAIAQPMRRPITPTPRQVKERFDDNTEAIGVLKKSAPIGVFFLIGYILIDSRTPLSSGTITVSPFHWMALATVMFFFGLTWLPAFRAYWRLWSLLCCVMIIGLMIAASAGTARIAEVTSRDLTIALCPFATASFVVWGWRWQLSLVVACALLYIAAEMAVPIGRPFELHWMLGLIAALTLSQVLAVFLGRYRDRLHRQLIELAEAAAFRETQIATMTHDIRDPLASLTGLVSLLAENNLDEQRRADLMSRVWATTSSMDLLVKNIVDLYLLEEQRLKATPRVIDVNGVVAEAAEQMSVQARLQGLKLRVELGSLPPARVDPLHLERIAANLIASAIKRSAAGVIVVRTIDRGEAVNIEISDSGPEVKVPEIERMFARPSMASGANPAALSRFIAGALVAANGGHTDARSGDRCGVTLIASLPAEVDSKADAAAIGEAVRLQERRVG